ncbi:hypothetical protein BRARA_A03917 [Brassica rapa]|uniref:Carboxypeptidase n=1 Tax=Brassica campestris TaxID=3711 RepID=A0A398AWV9_BRACM|nr:hypothetical protein BRARA_A03917 [Brassica rapa]
MRFSVQYHLLRIIISTKLQQQHFFHMVAEVFEGLTFVTVIGAGHEVPLSKPHAALELFKYFLRGKPLPK